MWHSCQIPNISCCVSKTYLLCTQASKNTTNGVFTDPCQPHVTCGPRPFINTISSPLLLYFRGKSILGKRISLRILFIWLMIFCFCDKNILYPMFFLIYRQSTATFCQPPNQKIYDSIHWHSAPDICHDVINVPMWVGHN